MSVIVTHTCNLEMFYFCETVKLKVYGRPSLYLISSLPPGFEWAATGSPSPATPGATFATATASTSIATRCTGSRRPGRWTAGSSTRPATGFQSAQEIGDRDGGSSSQMAQDEMTIRGRLHVSDSAFKSPYDSVHHLHTKGLGLPLSFGHQLLLRVNTY
jgi:hypothetical protein